VYVDGSVPMLTALVLGTSDELGTEPVACPEPEANPGALDPLCEFAAPEDWMDPRLVAQFWRAGG